MTRIGLIAGAIAALCSGCSDPAGTASAEWDDPAVAVCEWLAQHENVLPGQSYHRRVSVELAGTTVKLEFEVAALSTKPQLHQRECRFTLIDGGFRISEPPVPDLPASCDKDMEAAKRPIGGGIEGRNALKARLEECARLANRRVDILAIRATKRDIPLATTGLYPIDPESTALTAQ